MKDTDAIDQIKAGQKLYEQRARKALPVLVRQALLGNRVTYGSLAKELQMGSPRNLNYVLGTIGSALHQLGTIWRINIPPLQCLVVNSRTGIPGRGIGWFADPAKFQKLPRQQQRHVVDSELYRVSVFPKWPEVLAAFDLKPAIDDFTPILKRASEGKGGGEGPEHAALKKWVAANPALLKLPNSAIPTQEAPLPSGDRIDVLFTTAEEWIAVEVKPASSPPEDIVRGLFQCVKYQAVIEAYRPTILQPRTARAILVLEGAFPDEHRPLLAMLGTDVREHIVPAAAKGKAAQAGAQ